MKSLEEKKLLVKMAKMLGQPVDQALVESIAREEKLAAAFFGEKKEPVVQEKIPILKEDKSETEPPPPAPAFVPPIPDSVQQTVNLLNTVATANQQSPLPVVSSQKDVENLKRQVSEIMQKFSTLSWGGGGTGIVRIWDADDFERSSAADGYVMRYLNGMFRLDPTANIQVQADWTQANTAAVDYIKHKPLIWMDANNNIAIGSNLVPSNITSISIGTYDQPFANAYFGAHSVTILPDDPAGNTIVIENMNDTLGVTSGGFGVKDPTQTFYNFVVEYGGYCRMRTQTPITGRAVLELSANPSGNIIPLVSTAMGGAIHTTGAHYGPTLNTMDNFDNLNPTNSGNAIVFRRFRGTVDAPTAVQANDRMGSVAAAGYGDFYPYTPTGLPPGAQNSMIFRASENHTISNHGANVEFWAVPNGTNNAVQLVTLNPSGSNSGIVINQANSGISYGDGTFQNTASYPLTTKDEGTTLTATTKSINFVGGGVTANTTGNNVTVTIEGTSLLTYGSFSSSANQIAANANTAYAITLDTSNIPDGHYIRSNTQIVSNSSGYFHYHYTIQIASTNSNLSNFYCWMRKNGSNLANTTRITSLTSGRAYGLASADFIVSLNAGEYVELYWAINDTSTSIASPAAQSFCPATPSVVLTVQQIK